MILKVIRCGDRSEGSQALATMGWGINLCCVLLECGTLTSTAKYTAGRCSESVSPEHIKSNHA